MYVTYMQRPVTNANFVQLEDRQWLKSSNNILCFNFQFDLT